MVTMMSRPLTDRYIPTRATTALIRDSQPVDGRPPAVSGSWLGTCGSDIRASLRGSGVARSATPEPKRCVLLRVLDTLDEALQLFVTGELRVDRLHRIDEFRLVSDRNDLNTGRLDRLAGRLLTLVPELAHV